MGAQAILAQAHAAHSSSCHSFVFRRLRNKMAPAAVDLERQPEVCEEGCPWCGGVGMDVMTGDACTACSPCTSKSRSRRRRGTSEVSANSCLEESGSANSE